MTSVYQIAGDVWLLTLRGDQLLIVVVSKPPMAIVLRIVNRQHMAGKPKTQQQIRKQGSKAKNMTAKAKPFIRPSILYNLYRLLNGANPS